MYQTVFRDPGGNALIRISPDRTDCRHAVTDGSILLVPPGTAAYLAFNGILSEPYPPGRYELTTGTSPFFVRLRHLMAHGDPGTSVTVYYIATERTLQQTMGTGELLFTEQKFHLTLKALAACMFRYSIADPLRVLQKLVGSYSQSFAEEDVQFWLEQQMLAPVRQVLSRALNRWPVTSFNDHLSELSQSILPALQGDFRAIGLRLEKFQLNSINIPDAELARLRELEQTSAAGRLSTDLQLDELERIYGGSLDKRTLTEMLTGISGRGGQSSPAAPPPGGGMLNPMMQMLMMQQLLPSLRQQTEAITRQTDLFGTNGTDAPPEPPTQHAPPPRRGRIPPRRAVPPRRCPSCNTLISPHADSCPVCGHRFKP